MGQRHGEGGAHRQITRQFNVTWRNLGADGRLNSREWQVVAVGGGAYEAPDYM